MSYLSLGDRNDEEGDFFGAPPGASSGSRLGSLFGMNAQMDKSAGSNQSLTYTAPKAPKQGKQSDSGEGKQSQGASGVAIAVAVTAYRYLNNQYQKQGKLGAALLSNFAEKDYKILMYVSKQQPVTTAKITAEFQFNVQPNNYASFYDDQRQMWSILFDNTDQLISFAKQVCLAKYSCSDTSRVISQELSLGEQGTQPLESGDSVEAKYTGWLVQKGILGTVFDSNHKTKKTFRFKTGKGKVIKGWDQGMPGMKKGGKRFLIIPPTLAYGAKGAGHKVPPNSTLAFEVDVLRIKHVKEMSVQSSSSTDSVPQAVSQPEPTFGAKMEAPFPGVPAGGATGVASDDTVKGRTASFNDQLTHVNAPPDSDKAKLMSRMAKVGQAMLPHQPPTSTADNHQASPPSNPSPTLTQPAGPAPAARMSPPQPQPQMQVSTDAPQVRMAQSPAYSPSPITTMDQAYLHNPHVSGYPQAVPTQSMMIQPQTTHGAVPPGQFLPPTVTPYSGTLSGYQPPFVQMQHHPVGVGVGHEVLPSILTETRQHTSELKVLQEKVEKVSEKMDDLKKSAENSQGQQLPVDQTMDGALLSHNIQRIIQENDRMKKQLLEKNKQIEAQNDKIADLLQQNQKYVEESHLLMEKRNDTFKETFGQSQERTLQLEQEKVELTNKLSDATSKICELQLSIASLTEKSNSLESKVKETTSDAMQKHEEEQAKIQELEQQLAQAQKQIEEEQAKRKSLQVEVEEKTKASSDDSEENLQQFKQQLEEEKAKLLQDLEDLKSNRQEERENLKSKLEKEANTAKEELETKWKTKCKLAVAKVTEAAEEKMEELKEEYDEKSSKLSILQRKFIQLRKMYEEKVQSEKESQEQAEELDTVKQKYENLHKQATMMKEKYEARIGELEEESERRKETKEEPESKEDITTQVKVIMNTVFQQVRAKISSDEEYVGSQVLRIILDIIKATTLKLLTPKEESEAEEEEEEENKETEDEEEEDNKETEEEEEEDNKETEDEEEQDDKEREVGEAAATNGTKDEEEETSEETEEVDEENQQETDEEVEQVASEVVEDNEETQNGNKEESEEDEKQEETEEEKSGGEEVEEQKSETKENEQETRDNGDADVVEPTEKDEEATSQNDVVEQDAGEESPPEEVTSEETPQIQDKEDSEHPEQDEDVKKDSDEEFQIVEEVIPEKDEEVDPPNVESIKTEDSTDETQKLTQEEEDSQKEDAASKEGTKPTENGDTATANDNDGQARSISPSSDKPQPPPLFDDDDSDDDLDWLK